MIGGGGGEDVDFIAVDHFAHVDEAFDFETLLFGKFDEAEVEDRGIDVADGGDADAFHFGECAEVVLASAIDADDADADVIVGAEDFGMGEGEGGAETAGCLEKFAAGGGDGNGGFHGYKE